MSGQEAPRLRVALLHNYREASSTSMLLYAEQLGAALARRGLDVRRIRVPDVLPAQARRLTALDKLDSYVGRFLRYPRVARKARADVFHVVDHGQGHLVAALDPARTVVTCHDIILLVLAAGRLSQRFRPLLATRVLRHALGQVKRARGIIADSFQTRRDLADLGGFDPQRVTVIYPGLNHPFSPAPARRGEIRARLRLPEGPLVLHVGHTNFYKNIPGCLRAIARLRRGGLDVTFVRGGRPLRHEHVALAERLGIAKAVHELGLIAPDDLADLYRACDVFLFPSLYEGFGWPPLEAMASGLPVVSSRAGSLGEVVGEAALTAEPEDSERLADHVAALLLEESLREKVRARGLERAALFDWDRTALQIHDVYRRVLES
jgi:glycosyltransferase involved in cell wall biosynthesis